MSKGFESDMLTIAKREDRRGRPELLAFLSEQPEFPEFCCAHRNDIREKKRDVPRKYLDRCHIPDQQTFITLYYPYLMYHFKKKLEDLSYEVLPVLDFKMTEDGNFIRIDRRG